MAVDSVGVYSDIIESYKEGDWENVLNLHSSLNDSYFLWPKPTKCDLNFIAETLKSQNIRSIVSIGCGTGLLEWLLAASSDLSVVGIEIDENYWRSKYARASFIQLTFPNDNNYSNAIKDKESAIMFCYFNNRNAFIKYLEEFSGNYLIIIGPYNVGRHTDPGPFDTDIPTNWIIWKWKEIMKTGDYIAVFKKCDSQCDI